MSAREPIGVGKLLGGTVDTFFKRIWGFVLIGLIGGALLTMLGLILGAILGAVVAVIAGSF